MLTAEAIQKIVDLGSQSVSHPRADGGVEMLIPAGAQTVTLPPLDKPLVRIIQSVTMHDRESFTSYVNRYKSEDTRLFAEPGFLTTQGAHMTAVLDYHAANSTPMHGAHMAIYRPRYSDQWQRWHKAAQQPMKQAEFAEFIEEHRNDIVDPAAASLLDVVRTFKASKKVEFDSVVYQPNGDVTLAYDEKTQQQGKSGALPELMKLGIPVYFRGTVYSVPVFVRFKVGGGAVAFQLKIDRSDIIEDAAFSELTTAVREATGIEVYLGRKG